MTNVEILRHPTDEDWARCKLLALNTIGKRYTFSDVTDKWKHDILLSRHSPIRTLMFTIRVEMPYWVSVHFVRHKIGAEHFVSSQRNDRQDKYDRTEAPQGAMVSHIMDINAAELMQMAGMRLCGQASPETQEVMRAIRDAVIHANPEFAPFLVPKCKLYCGCNEFRSCGLSERVVV